ncbi:PAS domain S-box protein [Hymenobacter sp. AT01-02]|uniref:PAS domain-containing hybrid sensor histidine kinase/response regulator n=1 Tax=Hymenobacter sp. AT01-02 TaxID=1571877 RepID=UPI0005F199CB|nr:PAS domain S-box protein [Hymenobacter sp. AT01-02]
MSSISYRQLARRLRYVQNAYTTARQECQAAEQQLIELYTRSQAAAAQAAALSHTVNTALLAEDEQGIITLLNTRCCELLLLPQPSTTYIGQPSSVLLQDLAAVFREPERFREDRALITRSRERVSGQLYTLQNGTVLQQDYLPVVQNGRTVLHIWSYEDVTLHQQAQERVQELSQLAEQSPQPIIRYDAMGEARYANPAAARALHALEQPSEADVRQVLRQEIARALQAGQPHTFEQRLDGGFYMWTVAPLGTTDGVNVYLTDITLRRQAEAELVRSQLFTSRLNDTVPNIVFLYDMSTASVVYCNRQGELLLGYTEADIVGMGSTIAERILHPHDLETMRRRYGLFQVLEDGQVLSIEYRMRHKNGSWRWMSLKTTSFMRHPDGQAWQIIGSASDVTERRHAEEQLRQSRMLMERVTNTTPNLIYIFDIDKQANVYYNRYVETMLGYTEAEALELGDRFITRMIPPGEVRRLRRHLAEVASAADGEVLTMEFFLHHRNGSVRWLRVNNTPFERDTQGRVRQIVGSAEDITRWKVADEQRRSANRRLAEQNRLFRQVIDTVPNLIYLKDQHSNYVLANQATAQLYSMSTDELVHTPIEELQKVFPDLERYRRHDEQVLRTQQEMTQEETFSPGDDNVRWFYSTKRPFLLADGTVQVLGVDNDITALKCSEQALQRAKEVAEENAQARQTFLTNMSHEIRTPMNGILGLAELLTKTTLNEQQQQYLTHIQNSAEHLLVIINDILDMAQLGAGRIRLESLPFDLNEVLRSSCQSLMHKATEKGITLRLQLPPADVSTWVLGDPHRLRQVLLNLLNNAVKFTEKGHVLLTCQRVSAPGAEPQFQFTVLDTGIGISSAQLQQMFEPFAQASASTAREYGGSGLGLSISQGLVELLGGELSAESRLHHGSTFRFTLPFGVPTTGPGQQVEEPQPEYGALPNCRVLLAEDNAVNQLLVQAMLERWGVHVDTASSGPEALKLFRLHRYDVILMDIQMPGLDGVATTRLLREHPDSARAATPVVALTAHAMQGEEERYLQAGLDAYLSKPFRQQDLFRLIKNLLSGRPTATVPQPAAASAPLTPPSFLLTPAAPTDAPLYDLSNLLRSTDAAFVRRMAHLFITTTPPIVADLEMHLAAENRERIAATAHHLKSSTDSLRIQSLHGPLRRLETTHAETGAPTWDEIKQLVGLVRQKLDAVIVGLLEEFPMS